MPRKSTGRRAGAPRKAEVRSEYRDCVVHGVVLFRLHKCGLRDGVQRYQARCPQCHNEDNKSRRMA